MNKTIAGATAAVIATAVAAISVVALAGSEAAWKGSLQASYAAAAPGDTIVVPAGDYPLQTLTFDAAKTGARIVFQGGPGVRLAGFTTGSSGGSGNKVGAAHFELRDMEVGGQLKLTLADDVVLENISGGSFAFGSATNVVVRGGEFGPWTDGVNHINRCGSNPVCPPGGNILLDSVVLHDFLISDPAPHSECLMIWGPETYNVTIRNTIMRNCTDFGLLVKAPGATGIVIENSFFDVPMPGNVATTLCNPDCPRAGNSIRFSGVTTLYPGSRVTNNVVNGGIGVDCNCVPLSGNVPGVVPSVPPGPELPPVTTETVPDPLPPVTTETTPDPPTVTTAAPTCAAPTLGWKLPTRATITLTWASVPDATGYRLYKAGKAVSTAGATAVSAKFGNLPYSPTVLGIAAICADGEKLSEITTVETRTAG